MVSKNTKITISVVEAFNINDIITSAETGKSFVVKNIDSQTLLTLRPFRWYDSISYFFRGLLWKCFSWRRNKEDL